MQASIIDGKKVSAELREKLAEEIEQPPYNLAPISVWKAYEQLEKAKVMIRHMIGFYGSTPAYRPALDAEGLGELQPQLNKMSKEGDWAGMSAIITDEILETIAITGTPDEVAEKLIDRYGDFAQRLAPVGYSTDKETAKATLMALKKRLG